MTATPSISAYISYPGSLLEPSLLDLTIKSASILNPQSAAGGTVYDAWCLDERVQLPVPATYTSYVYSSYELGTLAASVPALTGNKMLANLDNINWLLNYYTGANAAYGDVQGAIWKMMGINPIADYVGPQSMANIDALVALAQAHDGYVPDVGESIGVVVDPTKGTAHLQPLIIEMKAAALGDYVWHDLNANGVQDTSESGIAGATVKLVRDQNGDGDVADANEVLATTTTDAAGAYRFKGLTPGLNYQVQFSLPAGFDAVSPRQAASTGTDSDALLSNVVVLAPGEDNRSIDAGFYQLASLGDRLWLDANGNGQQDAGEAGIAGVAVTLIGAGADGLIATTADNTSSATVTGADGAYAFSALKPGQYQVQFSKGQPEMQFTRQDQGDDASDSDVDAGGLSQVVTLSSGENNRTIDAGVFVPAALGDRVWLDANANGQQDDGEAGVAGVTITLAGGGADGLLATTADNTSATVTSDSDGRYAFAALTPGNQYQVHFAAPAGLVLTGANVGADSSDSDAAAGGLSQIVTLASGENNQTIDAGLYAPASLGDRVWLDANANGRQDAGEAGIAGVSVTLTSGGADGLIATAHDNTTDATSTDAQGAYRFDRLAPGGQYQLHFDKPAGSVFTRADLGDDALDSDADALGRSQVVTLVSGEHNPTIDAGIYTPASLGDRVWLDANANGRQDAGEAGIAGTTVTLTGGGADGLLATVADNTTASTTTGTDGTYGFANLTPGTEYQVGFSAPAGTVFTANDFGDDALDSDANSAGLAQVVTLASGENNTTIDAGVYAQASLGDRVWIDVNGNGQQDAGEAGVAGAAVSLIGGGADGLVATTGDNTSASTTTDSNGAYAFAGLTPGVEYQVQFTKAADAVFTRPDSGADATDSDAAANGLSHVVKLASGENNTTIDAGIHLPASLGDRLWLDANGNGQQDLGETGVSGASVTLIGGGADGLVATTADNTSATTVTGVDGAYAFSNLTPGMQYQVQFSKPSGYLFTSANTGVDASDSDADTTTGLSQIVVLGSGENNTTIDAGLLNRSGDLSVTKTDGVSSVLPGQSITYSIVVKNTGTALATDALVTDVLPTTLTNVTWTSAASAGASGNLTSGTGNISDYITLAGGASVTYTVTAKVAGMATLEKVANFGALTNNTSLGQNTTVNGIRADAFYINAGYQTTSTVLWERNVTGDHGLGVWSKGEGDPIAGGGDVNELSNQLNKEVIRLAKPDGEQWSSLWVSSLDGNGSGGAEVGTLYWSDTATPDLATLTTKFSFKYGDFGVGAVEGDLLTLRPAGFDAKAKYVFFVAGPSSAGTNNDFLVWKAATIPAQITNSATVAAPDNFTDTNAANNSATDVDTIALPTPAPVVRGSLGNFVWEDMNYNGLQDAGEAGIANVTVKLVDSAHNVLATTVTNASGNYTFANLNAGNYKIEVVAPTGYHVTRKDVTTNGGTSLTDSDIDATTGRSDNMPLKQGEHATNLDAGLYRKASIGDKVWQDVDHDNIQDSGEAGISGIKVMLYSGSGTWLATTTTNISGNYKFSNLTPGSYFLKFDKTGVNWKTYDMDNWAWGKKNVGSNDNIDSDVTGDAINEIGLTRTDATTLVSGENDMSWDAALTPIAIDLNGDGVQTISRADAGGKFDLLGTGNAIASGWLSADDGFLAVDRNGNGSIDSIAELFGGVSKGSGFAQLVAFDSNGDGLVDASDAAFGDLRIWQDANGNHRTDAGELVSLDKAGVVSLTVAHVDLPFIDAQGNLHIERSSATLANGVRADMTDVYFSISGQDAAGHDVQSVGELLADGEDGGAVLVGLQGELSFAY